MTEASGRVPWWFKNNFTMIDEFLDIYKGAEGFELDS